LPGLTEVFEGEFPKAEIQRCIVHKLRNIAVKLPRSIQKDCLEDCKKIFYEVSLEEAQRRFELWKAHWVKVAPGAVGCLEKDLKEVLTFYLFPNEHWIRVKSTNIIERIFKEFRRRTRQMDSFPNEECCLRCIYGIVKEMNERWELRRITPFSMVEEGFAA
jgi:putative transposase